MWGDAQGARVTLEAKIAALATKTTSELAADYIGLFGNAPRRRHPGFLRKRIAYRLQENALGGLPRAAREVLDRLIGEIALPAAPKPTTSDAPTADGKPRPGTVLTREWRGRTVRVEVTADGFVFDGERFGSLSAVARRVTGARWNGRLFFGLVGRAKP